VLHFIQHALFILKQKPQRRGNLRTYELHIHEHIYITHLKFQL